MPSSDCVTQMLADQAEKEFGVSVERNGHLFQLWDSGGVCRSFCEINHFVIFVKKFPSTANNIKWGVVHK